MYIIQEYQTDSNGNVAVVTPVEQANWFDALSVYHQKLMYAALAENIMIVVILCDNNGTEYKKEIVNKLNSNDSPPVEE